MDYTFNSTSWLSQYQRGSWRYPSENCSKCNIFNSKQFTDQRLQSLSSMSVCTKLLCPCKTKRRHSWPWFAKQIFPFWTLGRLISQLQCRGKVLCSLQGSGQGFRHSPIHAATTDHLHIQKPEFKVDKAARSHHVPLTSRLEKGSTERCTLPSPTLSCHPAGRHSTHLPTANISTLKN